MPLTNPPFARDPKQPPLHLREWTVDEFDQHRRLIAKQESTRPQEGKRNVPEPEPIR